MSKAIDNEASEDIPPSVVRIPNWWVVIQDSATRMKWLLTCNPEALFLPAIPNLPNQNEGRHYGWFESTKLRELISEHFDKPEVTYKEACDK